jgi:hypothetical protein
VALSFLSLQQACDNLLTCVCAELDRLPAEAGLAGCPCRACVVPGTPAVDGCDGGCDVAPDEYPGQLTVSVARTFTATRASFPAEISIVRDLSLCADPGFLAADLMVQVWRCAPGPSDDGCPPSCDALTEAATQLHADMLAVQRAITCCFSATNTDRRKGWRYRVGQSLPLGPQGGCVGFQAIVTVALEGALAPVPAG